MQLAKVVVPLLLKHLAELGHAPPYADASDVLFEPPACRRGREAAYEVVPDGLEVPVHAGHSVRKGAAQSAVVTTAVDGHLFTWASNHADDGPIVLGQALNVTGPNVAAEALLVTDDTYQE